MADNLSITIGADTAKARHELELLNAQMRVTQKEIKATADTAAKTGDQKALADLKTLTAAYDGMAKKVVTLRKEVTATNRAHKEHAHGFYLVENSVQSLNGAFQALGHNLAGARAGIAGFVVGIGFQEVLKQIEEAQKRLRDIRDLGREIGQKPLVTQAVQELAKETGESAETANKFLQGLGATLAKIATQAKDIGGSTANQRELDKKIAAAGGLVQGVQVSRGGVTPVRDFSDPLSILGVNAERLAKLAPEQQMKELGDAFLRAQKNARALQLTEIQLNEISKEVFGLPAEAATKLIAAQEKRRQKDEELRKSQRGATKERLDGIDKEAAAQEKLGQAWQEVTGRMANATEDLRLGALKRLTDTLTGKLPVMGSNWTRLLGLFGKLFGIGGAQATPSTTLPDVNVSATRALPQLFQGPSSAGDTTGHGYESIGGFESGHGPGSYVTDKSGNLVPRTQSTTPGLSNYQAPPHQMVQPMIEAARSADDAAKSSQTASEKAADAAAAAQSAAEASRSAVDALSFKQNSPFNAFASGGMIRGPGSGTSDSIMARLSNGEFVMSARAVSHWGPSLMQALNGMVNPGFLGGSMPRFAEGGLVSTSSVSGGTPVHLHLDGQSFVTHADEAVAGALVAHSRRYQMRSAGVKPSWYGGRPGQ